MRRVRRGLASFACGLAVLLGGCDGSSDPARRASAALSSVAVAPALGVLANGSEPAQITVVVRDQHGRPMANQLVALELSGAGVGLAPSQGASDSSGAFVAATTSTVAELKTITATVGTGLQSVQLVAQPQVEFIADAGALSATLSTVSAAPLAGVVADGTANTTIVVTLRDAHGNAVPGITVEFAASGSNNTIAPASALTDAQGVATATLASITAETKSITITAAPGPAQVVLVDQPLVEFIGDASNLSAALSSIDVLPLGDIVADGVSLATISVTARDVYGNAVSGRSVALTASGASNWLEQPSAPTDGAGVTGGTLRSTHAEVKTISATLDPGPNELVLAAPASVTFIGDRNAIDPTLSACTASPSVDVVADGVSSSVLSALIVDVNGNSVADVAVLFTVDGAGNTVTQPASTTDAFGAAAGALASTVAELKTITATVEPGPNAVVLAAQPTARFIADANNLSATLSSAAASPSSNVTANGVALSTISVVARDAHGNRVPDLEVAFAASGGANTLTPSNTVTDALGAIAATLASTQAQTKTLTITLDPAGLAVVVADQPTIQFVADASTLSSTLSTAAALPSTGVIADGGAFSTISVVARDAYGNPAPGIAVEFAVSGSSNTLTPSSATTDASGAVFATLASTRAESKVVTVTLQPGAAAVVLANPLTIEFVGDPSTIDAVLSSCTASPSLGVVADDLEVVTLTAIVRDVNSNPVAGRTVTFAVSGSDNALTQPVVVTNAAGVAVGALTSTRAETKLITATVDPGASQVVLVDQPTAEFIADLSNLSAALSTASAAPTSGVIADGVELALISVVARDAHGNLAAGVAVELSVSGASNTLTPPSATTDAAGAIAATLASTRAETKVVTVTLDPGPNAVVLDDQPTIEFVGDPSTIDSVLSSCTSSPSLGVVANDLETVTLTAIVRDVNSNPVAGRTVTFAVSGSDNTLTQPAVVTNAAGVAVGALTSTKAETKLITATVDPGASQVVLADQPTAEFIADASQLSATLSTASASPATGVIADGVQISTLTVTAFDVHGNVVAGRTVELAASGSGNLLVQPGATTDANGVATATLASTVAELKTLTVTLAPGASAVVLVTQPTVEFVADPGTISALLSTAVASPGLGLVADGVDASTVTVTILDAHGNAVPGRTVQLSSSGVGHTLTQPAAVTDALGVATGSMVSTRAQTKSLTITVDPGPAQMVLAAHPTIEFVADVSNLSAALSTASALPSSGVVADGVQLALISVVARDAHGNLAPGVAVEFAVSGSSNALTPLAATTDAFGAIAATLASTRAETKVVTVTLDPGANAVVLDDQPTIEFVGDPSTIDAALSSCTASPSLGVVADDVEVVTLTAIVRDVNSNPVAGRTVTFSSSGSDNTLTQPIAVTNAAGVAVGTLTSTKAETKLITATIDPGASQVVLADQPTAEFIADVSNLSAALSSASAAPTSGVIADGVELALISVVARDAHGNLAPGVAVEFAASGSSNTLTPLAATTDAFGAIAATLASTRAETKVVTVTLDPGANAVVLDDQPMIEFVGDPSTIDAALSSCTASPALGVVADDVEVVTLTAVARDVNSNPVAGRTVSFASSGSDNTLTQPGAVTNAAGVAVGTLTSTKAETKLITATIDPGASQVVLADQPTAEFIADVSNLSAVLSSASALPLSGVIADGVELALISVVARDAHGNLAPGVAVEFAASGSANTLTPLAATTDAFGAIAATLASTRAETKIVTVTLDPGPNAVVLDDQPTIEFIADVSNLSAALSSASALPSRGVIADGVELALISVVARDAHGNLAPGVAVEFAASGTSNTLTPLAATTDALGAIAATLASTRAETKVVTVTLDPGANAVVLDDQPTIEFVGDPSTIDAALSSCTASPSLGVVADDVEVVTLTAIVRDVNANPVSGRTVTFASSGSDNTLTQPIAVTNAAGVAVGTLTSTKAETKLITATIDPGASQVVLADQPTAEFIADAANPSAALSDFTAAPTSNVVADGVESSLLTATVRDTYGNPIEGLSVSIAASGSGNTLTQPAALTDQNGVTTGSLASTVAQTKSVVATVDPGGADVVLADQPSVAFVGDPDALDGLLSTIEVDPQFGALADGVDSVLITVTARDVNGNAVAGRTVQLAATGSGNALTQPVATTNSAGVATGAIATTSAETKSISATLEPGASAVAVATSTDTAFVWPSSRRRYVRASGRDSASGDSPAAAWRSLGKAASSVVAGDTVFVGAGQYFENVVITTDGTAANPIVFFADELGEHTGDGGDVIVDGQDSGHVLTIDGADDVTIEGFTLQAGGQGSGAGVRVGDTATQRVRIRRNRIVSNGAGIFATNASELVIEGNRISRQRRATGLLPSGGHGLELATCTSVDVRNNLIYANEGCGFLISGTSTSVGVEANTFYANEDDQVRIGGPLTIASVQDNVLALGLGDGIVLELGALATSLHNVSWGHVGLDWSGLALGVGDLNVDPLLVDPDGPDDILGGLGAADDRFELDTSPSSPALDAGALLSTLLNLLDGETLADLTTREDGVLDGTAPDGASANIGFHYAPTVAAPTALAANDVRVLLASGAKRQPLAWSFDSQSSFWSGPAALLPVGATLRWIEHAFSPLASDEEFAACAWSDGSATQIEMLRGGSLAWRTEFVVDGAAAAAMHVRGFDLECTHAGDALFVYADGSSNPLYRFRTQGEWSDAAEIFALAPGLGAVRWVELAPRANDSELTLVYSDSLGGLYAVVWNGSSWDTANVATLEILLRSSDLRSFDVSYETTSGDALVVWAGPLNALEYATRAAGATSWSTASGIGALGFTPAYFDLAADPGSNRIAMAGLEDAAAGEEPKVAMWSGAAWADGARLETGNGVSLGTAAGRMCMSVGWVGTSGVAVAIYADNTSGAIDWGRWSSGSGWSLQSDVAVAGKTTTESIVLEPHPSGAAVMALLSDADGNLFAARYDGTSWTITNAGAALEADLSTLSGAPFAASVR